jgi:hypothetical protein
MADEFTKNNNAGTRALFYDRQLYQATAGMAQPEWYASSGVTNLQDFRESEKILYGRVNRYYVPIFLDTKRTDLSSITFGASGLGQISALPFVAEAFSQLSMQFQKGIVSGKISPDERYLSDLKAEIAFEDPQNLYYIYTNKISGQLVNFYVENKIVFKDFKEFLVHLKESWRRTAPVFPITFPAYMKSRYCPITTTGLVVEIADNLSCADDQTKFDDFVASKNWKFYVNACRSYGFAVDLNNPWRLIADIGSGEMVKYARKYGFSSTDDILESAYTVAHMPFYTGFKSFVLSLYNQLRTKQYMVSEYCQNSQVKTRIEYSMEYKVEDLEKLFPETFFIDLYCYLRFLEEETKFSSAEQERITKDCMELYRIRGISEALNQFEKILNKTYSYRGSLTDRMNRAIL